MAALSVSACFGVAYTTLAYTIAHTSGAHMNPAISTAMVVSGYTSLLQVAPSLDLAALPLYCDLSCS